MTFSDQKVAKVATRKKQENCDVDQSGSKNKHVEKIRLVSHVSDFSDQKVAKVAKNFECLTCDYNTSKKSNYDKHLLTIMHTKKEKNIMSINNFKCDGCKKTYQSKNGLWVHKKKCKELHSLTNLVVEVVKQNQEFQKLIIEQNKQIINLSKTINITNNNCTTVTNNSFNINLFLNEKCKDALNINDFVHSLNVTLSDLENVGTTGFINGISNIFVKGLKELDIYKRPVHCSDLKRETIYIKGENVWEKENEEKEKIKKAIKEIANKNIQKISEWTIAHPSCKNSSSKTNDQYLKILNESMCSETKEEDDEKYNKIIKNVVKEVIIDKI